MSKQTFIDNIGRSILGENMGETDATILIKNPCMINVAQLENGQLQVQLIPIFFAEFLSEESRDEGSVWSYNKTQITSTQKIDLDQKLTDQYDRIFNPKKVVTPSDNVVKLFDAA